MNSAIGFTAIQRGTEGQINSAASAHARALRHYPDIRQITLQHGATQLTLWARGVVEDCCYNLPDGSLLALIGSPLGEYSLPAIAEMFNKPGGRGGFQLPYDGRVILLHINADGSHWTLWNDWLGSIPVYYTHSPLSRIASTLEPVVVTANGFSKADIHLPSIVFLLTHGHFLGDATLYKGMCFVPPDCRMEWDDDGCRYEQFFTIIGTQDLWERGYNSLLDEMHELARKAIVDVLKTQPFWIVPLSAGLDSRLIAAVAAEEHANVATYTWGGPSTLDGIHGEQVARKLKLPWKRVELSNNYLSKNAQAWFDLFGSSMHFHGAYQLSFLEKMKQEPAGKIVTGFIGDSTAWAECDEYTIMHSPDERVYQVIADGYLVWDAKDVKQLLKIPVDDVFEQIGDEIHTRLHQGKGALYQKIMTLQLWERQRHFTYFQSMLSDYARGVATPYLNKDYARFCFGLPWHLVEDRRLLINMMLRYYGGAMTVPGTYAVEPALLTGSYLLKRRAAKMLPRQFSRKLFPEFFTSQSINTDVTSMRACGDQAIWPIRETASILSEWMDMKVVDSVYRAAINGDVVSVRKLQCIQAVAYRLLDIEQDGAMPGNHL